MNASKAKSLALKVTIDEMPFAANVTLWRRVKDRRNESFKTLAPSGQPAKQGKQIDSATGKPFSGPTRKGVKVGKDEYVPLPEGAEDKIKEGTSTKIIDAATSAFCPLNSIALDLAIQRYAVRPDSKVEGAKEALNIIWNGLRESQAAWVSQVSFSGGHDSISVLYADESGMWMALLPFEEECYPTPTPEFVENERQAELFASEVLGDVDEFDHSGWVSEYRTRRAKVIADKPVEVDSPPEQATEVKQDLMAMLEKSAKKKKPAAKKAPAKKKAA
jgi:non-homologous end joining protein Ku